MEGLSNDSGIMGETDYALSHSIKIKQKKTNALKEEWDAEVCCCISYIPNHGLEAPLQAQHQELA